MIKEQWYAVLYSHEITQKRALAVLRFGEKLIFFRDKKTGLLACLSDICPHRGASLSLGVLKEKEPALTESLSPDTTIACPFHGLEFDRSGRCIKIPANGKNSIPENQYKARSYTVHEAYGFVWVYWGKKKEQLPKIAFFENLTDTSVKLAYAQTKDYWKCHYSRCVENQLDVVHVPFVHYNTIGRGNKTLVNGPAVNEVDLKNNDGKTGLLFYADNEVDRGQKPKTTAQETPVNVESMHIAFRFPNLWQNYIHKKMRVFIAFVPVDEHNTILYMRVYQGFTRLPILKQLFNFILLQYSRKIAHQDRRVVETQKPDATKLEMNEHLIAGDLPIIMYRKKRNELLKKNVL